MTPMLVLSPPAPTPVVPSTMLHTLTVLCSSPVTSRQSGSTRRLRANAPHGRDDDLMVSAGAMARAHRRGCRTTAWTPFVWVRAA